MPPSFGKLQVNTSKKNTPPSDSGSAASLSATTPVTQSAILSTSSPTSVAAKAQNAFKRLRTLSAVSSKKRQPSTASKHSLNSEFGNFFTFNLEQEKSTAFIEEKKLNSLQKAVFEKELKKVQKLLAESKRETDKLDTTYHFTALFLAVQCNNIELAEYLLTAEGKKADPNVICHKGRTALMMVSLFFVFSFMNLF